MGRLARITVTALGYLAVAWMGLRVASPPGNVSALWPASGLSLAAMLVWGRGVWPGVLLGALVVNLAYFPGGGPWAVRLVGAVVIALGNVGEAYIATRCAERWLGGREALSTPARAYGLFGVAAASALVAASVGAAVTAMATSLSIDAAMRVWVTWWIGDAVGILAVAPLAMAQRARSRHPAEAVALALATLTVLQVVFGRPFSITPGLWLPLAWVLLPVVVWCGTRFDAPAVAAQVLLTHALVSWATVTGRGPFALLSPQTALLVQDGFLLVVVLPGLVLVASQSQSLRARAALEADRRNLEARVAERTATLEATHRALTDEVEARGRVTAQLIEAQKQEALGRLAGGVAHDFNNLLTVISGEAEVLLDAAELSPSAREGAEAILATSRRAGEVTRQLLAFARRQPASPTRVDVGEALARLRRMVRPVFPANVAVEVAGEKTAVRIDPVQFDQVLLNLCLNARDAMPRGGLLRIEHRALTDDDVAARSLAPGAWVELTVRDTGEGIAEALLPRIFEPFFTTRPQGQGTGLGLSTAQGIVTQARGHLRVQSAVGEGTTFTILLPADDTPEASPTTSGETSRVSAPEGATILVCEDEPLVRRLVVQLLTRAGYVVLDASNGVEALEIARARRGEIKLVLTDVVMPRMGGRELAEALRAESSTRVAFMSGYHEHTEALAHERMLAKPFTAESLTRFVADALSARAR